MTRFTANWIEMAKLKYYKQVEHQKVSEKL